MSPRENLLSLYRRRGYDAAPVCFHLCPHLEREFHRPGKKGGLFCSPAHMLEPEVPRENVEAYVEAARTFHFVG